MVRFAIASFAIVVALFGGSRQAHAGQVLLLDFTSPQCGPCQQMAPTVESFKSAGYPIRGIDTTRDIDTTRQFKVARVPMLVMLVDGQEFERVQGGMSGSELEAMFQRANREVERRNQSRIRAQSPDRGATLQPALDRNSPGVANAIRPEAAAGSGAAANGAPGAQHSPRRDDAVSAAALRQMPPNNARTTPNSAADSVPLSAATISGLVNASVRLRVEDSAGYGYGTGTIIDTRQGEALVVTCGHLFRQSKGQGPLTVELFESTPTGVRSVGQVPGLVISYDLERDIALVAIRPGRAVAVAQVAPPRAMIERGSRVVSVGCSNGQDPTVLASRVTSLDRYQGPPNIEVSGAPVEGRSGGGLFNEQGQLIGICFAADHESNEGLYAALKVIHDELASHGLSDVFTGPPAPGANAELLASGQTASGGAVLRGQDPGRATLPPQRSASADVPAGAVAVNQSNITAVPASLTVPAEQAAWEEIMGRAASAEVICIIRPKQSGGQSEVITLDNMSPEFVQALAALRKAPSVAAR